MPTSPEIPESPGVPNPTFEGYAYTDIPVPRDPTSSAAAARESYQTMMRDIEGTMGPSTTLDEVGEISGVSPTSQKKSGTSLTPEIEAALSLALDAWRMAESMRSEQRYLPTDRRESEYMDLMRNEIRGSISIQDLLGSEEPIWLNDVDTELVKKLCAEGFKYTFPREGKTIFVCSKCKLEVPRHYAFMCLGTLYCASHIPRAEECIACNQPTADYKDIDSIEGTKIRVCNRCIPRLRCGICEHIITPAYAGVNRCANCYVSTPNSYPRPYSRNKAWMSEELGAFIQSKRPFSFELEFGLHAPGIVGVVMEAIPREVGMSGDGSIRVRGVAVEIQSPRLQGARGEELTLRTVAGLKKGSAFVNDTCGFHIHLDGAGLIPDSRKEFPARLISLWKAHLVFEDVILSFLPFGRRLNRYCRPMRDYFKLSEIDLIRSMYDAEKLWYRQRSYSSIAEDKGHHYHPSRYFGFNLHSLLGQRNLEIRYHTGTLNAKKIFHWVNLHSLIMDNAGRFPETFLNEAQATSNLREKTDMLFKQIGLNKKSQEYFFARQRKFNDKGQIDDEQVVAPPRSPNYFIRSRPLDLS